MTYDIQPSKTRFGKICSSVIVAMLSSFVSLPITDAAKSADEAIANVYSYGFVDLEGAKPSAIIIEYDREIAADSISNIAYAVTNYVIRQEKALGFQEAIEQDYDNTPGNEGQIIGVYVNDKPEISATGGTAHGKYVILELNTAYMMSGQNLPYTTSMMAGVRQVKDVRYADGTIIAAGNKETANYHVSEEKGVWGGKTKPRTVIDTDTNKIILPEFEAESGWKQHFIGKNAFFAKHCYSEYTGKYEDFELPYSIYVPPREILMSHKGKIPLVLHMEHAGGNDIDPMSAVTSSRAAVKLTNPAWQKENPAIILVPQIEESRRSTDDFMASSEANTAVWELVDSVMENYRGYIDENRIYGTGQSMGGMTILNMAAQRDNFFAGIAVVGAQWGNSYNKEDQHNGAAARTPENDPISFNGFGLDRENFQNWYYMVSDDNILVQTCSGDPLATGLWGDFAAYYAAVGVKIPHAEWDPYLPTAEQEKLGKSILPPNDTTPGAGIHWASFTRGSHMSTWKYGYRLDYPLKWLFTRTRESEQIRGKLTRLKNPWLGRDKAGHIKSGSGTANLNSAQYTPHGASETYTEGWKP